ncbi:hypothetical protein POM88_052577 [Heracleum sosnowskyi]|uniref:Uncharacterized protein n=1 Tax=Heracleum sosnowskyi TaxID=360622 RepID=A0AAD8GS98_9APIA|nr:hypothetical protein POM88_052577 [Heracleum sosnowskyi]
MPLYTIWDYHGGKDTPRVQVGTSSSNINYRDDDMYDAHDDDFEDSRDWILMKASESDKEPYVARIQKIKTDTGSAYTIEGKCIVHSLEDYTKLEDVGAEDYYSRFEYEVGSKEFTPDGVVVYCKCEMPYNQWRIAFKDPQAGVKPPGVWKTLLGVISQVRTTNNLQRFVGHG